MNATLRIEPHMPNTLEVFIPQAIALAQQLLVHVAFDWNGVNVTVLRDSDAEEVIAAVRRAMLSDNDVIGECEVCRAVDANGPTCPQCKGRLDYICHACEKTWASDADGGE